MVFYSVTTVLWKNNKTWHLSIWWYFELLQFSIVCWSPRFLLKHSSNLLKRFAFGLRDTEINEHREAKKEHSKQDEHVTIQPSLVRRITKFKSEVLQEKGFPMTWCAYTVGLPSYLDIRKSHAYDEVTGPVAAACKSNGCRSWPLAEQLSYYEPWNRTWTDLKETHKEEGSRHADIAHPWEVILMGKHEIGKYSHERCVTCCVTICKKIDR